jgi:hypothetical protein
MDLFFTFLNAFAYTLGRLVDYRQALADILLGQPLARLEDFDRAHYS